MRCQVPGLVCGAGALRGREHGDFRPLETQPLTAEVISAHLDTSAATG
ncbi:hypothetical protein AAHB37_08360 [Glutamicibacter halophytocola]